MSAASARAALIDLAFTWRLAGGQMDSHYFDSGRAAVYAECAKQLDETTILHLSSSVTTDQWASTQLGRAVDAFTQAMAIEGVPLQKIERVVNLVLHGHPDGVEAARITGRTTECQHVGGALCANHCPPREGPQ